MPDEYRDYLDLLLDHRGCVTDGCPECRMLWAISQLMAEMLNAEVKYPVEIRRKAVENQPEASAA